MEKIYMEDSSNSQSSQSSQSSSKDYKRQFKISVILSFVVAFFAIYSLIACGISQVSYAAPSGGESVPAETFTFRNEGYSLLAFKGTLYKNVPIYFGIFGEERRNIFCIEPEANTVDGTSYVVSGSEDDAGLLYLLSLFYNEDGTDKLYTNDYTFDLTNAANVPDWFDYNSLNAQEKALYNTTFKMYFDSFIKQSAIWAYLYKVNGNNDEASKLMDFDKVHVRDNSTADIFIFNYANDTNNAVYKAKAKINELVTQALNPSNYAAVDVNLVETQSLSKNDDGNYQVSYRIEVPSNASNVQGYKISLSGTIGSSDNTLGVVADDLTSSDAWIVDENGNVIEDGVISCNTGSSCTNKFTVVVNKDHISEKDKTYSINVKLDATVGGLYGRRYVAADGSNLQKVVSVGGNSYTSSNSKSFTIVTTEDTGMTTAQTIYFIGLVVLLCGIGIVYANAKPAESKQ